MKKTIIYKVSDLPKSLSLVDIDPYPTVVKKTKKKTSKKAKESKKK